METSGPFEDKERAEVKRPKQPKKSGPKNEGKILLTYNMLQFKKLIKQGFNTSVKINKNLQTQRTSAVASVLTRMHSIGMVSRKDVGKGNCVKYVYSVEEDFDDRFHCYDPIK